MDKKHELERTKALVNSRDISSIETLDFPEASAAILNFDPPIVACALLDSMKPLPAAKIILYCRILARRDKNERARQIVNKADELSLVAARGPIFVKEYISPPVSSVDAANPS